MPFNRNAALQLFGAIVPKFIGQKKGVIGTNEDSNYDQQSSEGILHIKMDYLFIDAGELFLHYPELTNIISKSLVENTKVNSIANHACLVPVLSLLNGVLAGISVLYDKNLEQIISNYQNACLKLLSSRIQVVRNLSAKCYASLTQLPDLKNKITYLCQQMIVNKTENFIHGSLLTLSYLVDKFLTQGKFMFNKRIETDIYEEILNLHNNFTNSTYYTKTLYLNLVCSIKNNEIDNNWINSYEYLLKCTDNLEFGVHIYIQNLTKQLVTYCDLQLIPELLDIVLRADNNDVVRTFFIYLTNRLDTIKYENHIIFDKLFNFILDHTSIISVDCICLILQVMLKALDKTSKCCPIKLHNFYKIIIESNEYSINIITLGILVVTSILNIKYDENIDREKCGFIKSLITGTCNYAEYCTEDVRINVAKSLNNIITILYKMSKYDIQFSESIFEDKIKCINTILNLLQDENVAIRNEMTNFYSNYLNYKGRYLNPTVCLLLFLNSKFLKDLFSGCSIYLERKLHDLELQNGIDSQNAESLQYLTNVFYEQFFLKIIMSKSINMCDVKSDLLAINNEYFNI